MTDLIIQGICGRMGRALIEKAGQRDDCRIVAGVDQAAGEINGIVLEINHFVSDEIPREDLILFYKTLETIARNLQRAVEHYT